MKSLRMHNDWTDEVKIWPYSQHWELEFALKLAVWEETGLSWSEYFGHLLIGGMYDFHFEDEDGNAYGWSARLAKMQRVLVQEKAKQ